MDGARLRLPRDAPVFRWELAHGRERLVSVLVLSQVLPSSFHERFTKILF